jgi:hypothetical protein
MRFQDAAKDARDVVYAGIQAREAVQPPGSFRCQYPVNTPQGYTNGAKRCMNRSAEGLSRLDKPLLMSGWFEAASARRLATS